MTGKYIPRPVIQLASYQFAAPLFHALLFVSPHLIVSPRPSPPRYRFSIPRLRIVLSTFCLSDPMRLDSSHIVTPRFFSPHFNRSHSTIKSVLFIFNSSYLLPMKKAFNAYKELIDSYKSDIKYLQNKINFLERKLGYYRVGIDQNGKVCQIRVGSPFC